MKKRTFQSSGEIHNQLSFRFRPGLVLCSFNFCLPRIVFNFDNLAYDQSRLYTVMLFHILCWRKLLWGHKWQMLMIMMNRCLSQKRYYKKLFWNERIITITNFFFVHGLCVMFPYALGYCTFQLFYKMILLEKMSEQKVWHSLN